MKYISCCAALPGIRRGARIGASAGPSSGVLAPPYGPGAGCVGCPPVAARRGAHDVKFTGVRSVCNFSESDVIRGDAAGLWSGTVPFGSSPVHGARLAAHYMAAMGLWRPPGSLGADLIMLCYNCFPDLSK